MGGEQCVVRPSCEKLQGLRYVRVRELVYFILFITFICAAQKAESMDYIFNDVENIFVEVPEQSCYNYTFLDKESVNGTLLEKGRYSENRELENPVFYDSRMNACRNNNRVSLSSLSEGDGQDANASTDAPSGDYSLLPNPEIGFVEDGQISYRSFHSRNTLFLGGVVPFVAVPDSDLANEDHFFNNESFSFFLYFKRKF
jgi:hypothetical protein